MDLGGVDHEAADTGLPGRAGQLGRGLARRHTEVRRGVQLPVAGVREERRRGRCPSRTTGARSSRTPSSTTPRSVSPVPCSQRLVTPPSRSTSASSWARFASSARTSARTSQSPWRVGRPLGLPVLEQVGRAERGDLDAVERGPGELLPHQRVGVVVAQPLGLAQHRGRRGLPVRDAWRCPRGTRGRANPGRARARRARPARPRPCRSSVMVRTLEAVSTPSLAGVTIRTRDVSNSSATPASTVSVVKVKDPEGQTWRVTRRWVPWRRASQGLTWMALPTSRPASATTRSARSSS